MTFQIPYDGNLDWLVPRTILFTLFGSRAYGTDRPESDWDYRGVCIPPRRYRDGFLHRFEQAELKGDADGTIYGIRKFMKLAAECNPSIIEVLFVDDAAVLHSTPLGDRLREAREQFLSRKACYTFRGYAVQQLRRIETHRKWLLEPLTHRPERSEFGLSEPPAIPDNQVKAALAMVRARVDTWEIDFGDLEAAEKIYVMEQMYAFLVDVLVGSDPAAFGMGEQLSGHKFEAACRHLGFDENFIDLIHREKRWRSAVKKWDQHNEWKKNRNEARAALEAKHGFDCHTDDTEFLTAEGWKTYDAVTAEDKLASVYLNDPYGEGLNGFSRPRHSVPLGQQWGTLGYFPYLDRFEGLFTGNLYHFEGHHTDVLVTPNHRMLVRRVERNLRVEHDWGLREASRLGDSFDFLRTVVPVTKTYGTGHYFEGLPIPAGTYLRLMGWFLSDGTLQFRKGRPHAIVVSQKQGGRLSARMARFFRRWNGKVACGLYGYKRGADGYRSQPMVEKVLNVREKALVQRLYEDCGHSKGKRIPRWVFGLSQGLKGILMDALMAGDGTRRKQGTEVYYSSLRGLADDVQELAVTAGWESTLWGPYRSEPTSTLMFQVFVSRRAPRHQRFTRNNLTVVPVEGRRVVCFTVPYGTLITRRNGRVSIHGNSKHGMHLVRLLRMCREILTGQGVLVRRPDAEELNAIRDGAWTYEQLMEWAKREDKDLIEVARTSPLPSLPDRHALDALCQELVVGQEQFGE